MSGRTLGILRLASIALAVFAATSQISCSDSTDTQESPQEFEVDGQTVVKASAEARAARRAFDGAPPVIPHTPQGSDCTRCHDHDGMEIPGMGFAPPLPHGQTAGMSEFANCRQCHVFRSTDEVFQDSEFVGLAQDFRQGDRHFDGAPPVMPHSAFMRENCQACHTGPSAREQIRCSHPERINCTQCHVEDTSDSTFVRPGT